AGRARAARVHDPAPGHPTADRWHAARRLRHNWLGAIREAPLRVALVAKNPGRARTVVRAQRLGSVPVETTGLARGPGHGRVAALLMTAVGDTSPGAHLGAFPPRARRLGVEAPHLARRPGLRRVAPRRLAGVVHTGPRPHLRARLHARRLGVEAPRLARRPRLRRR